MDTVQPVMAPSRVSAHATERSKETAYAEQAEMRQGENSRSRCHIIRNLEREILVEPARVVCGGGPGTSVKDIAELVGRLWADSVRAEVNRKGDADLDARFDRSLEPINSVTKCIMDLVLNSYGLDDLGREIPPSTQDSPISGRTKFNSLAEYRRHSAKNRDSSEELHLWKGSKKRRERMRYSRR